MVISIRQYINQLTESMAKEAMLREQELTTQTLLKEAQLNYLQAQINPHFLFNTLNAGMQLATIEDAERTAIFIENMAEFFRYNITKTDKITTLGEEVTLIDHYIYILNVLFSVDLHSV